MRKLKVLIVVEATTAGVKQHLLTLLPALDRNRFALTVACPAVRSCAEADTSFVDDVRRLDIPTAIVDMRRSVHPVLDGRAILSLYQLLRQGRYDVVHAHSSKAGVLARPAAWWARTPAILYTPHAFAFLGYSGWRRWTLVQIERLLSRVTDIVICVSEAERQVALRYGVVPAHKLTVIENAVNWQRDAPTREDVERIRQSLGLTREAPVIGTVGRLVRQKGVDRLLLAARRVLDSHPDTRFLIVGEGPLREALERLARRLGISDSVRFTGYRGDVPALLSLCDVFVLSSRYEGRSYSLLETMAAGRPIVATDVAGNREVVRSEKTGLLVPPGDAAALAGAIVYLLDNPDAAQRLGQAAQQAIRRERGAGTMAREVAQLYTPPARAAG